MVATANQDNAKTGEEMKKTDKWIKRLITEKPSITLDAQTSWFDLNNKIEIPKGMASLKENYPDIQDYVRNPYSQDNEEKK